jgi:hypothetical protein
MVQDLVAYKPCYSMNKNMDYIHRIQISGPPKHSCYMNNTMGSIHNTIRPFPEDQEATPNPSV